MKTTKIFSDLAEWRSFVDSEVRKPAHNLFFSIWKNIVTSSNKFDIFITISLILFQCIPYFNLIKNFWKWNGSGNYHSLDSWLITYDGGFIRRGLSGEVIKILEYLTNLLPHIIVAITSITVFVILVIWTISMCGKKIPTFFIFSPVFFAITARWDVLFSTDYIMLLLFLCALKIIVSNYHQITIYILVNFICVFAILMKEIYVFSCLPILVIVYNLRNYNRFFSINCLPFFLLPILALSTVVHNNVSNPESILKVAEYWNEIYRQKIPDFCCFENGYFEFFEKSWVDHHLPKMKIYWSIVLYGFIWFPVYWLFMWFFCGLFTAKIINHYDVGKEKNFLGFYYISTICSLPLYFLAFDYGRWILLAIISSFLATYTTTGIIQSPKFVNKIQVRIWKSSLKFWQKALIVMCFGVPGYILDFSVVYYSAPIWYPMQFIISIPELDELGLLGK